MASDSVGVDSALAGVLQLTWRGFSPYCLRETEVNYSSLPAYVQLLSDSLTTGFPVQSTEEDPYL